MNKPIRLSIIITLASCSADPLCDGPLCELDPSEIEALSALTPLGPPPPDRSNAYVGNQEAITLGWRLFFDPWFAGTAILENASGHAVPYGAGGARKGDRMKLSCASCHDLKRSGSDTESIPGHISVGSGWSSVNARPVVNAAYYDLPFWNGREDSLWAMILPVMEAKGVLNTTRAAVADRLRTHYAQEYASVFPQYPIPEGDLTADEVRPRVTRVFVNFAKAIAAYEYELRSGDTRFDRYMRGEGRLADAEIRGARLFVGKAACISCHGTPLFSDSQYHNIGVPQIGEGVPTEAQCVVSKPCQPYGFFTGLANLQGEAPTPYRRVDELSDDPTDRSRARYYTLERTDSLKGTWRTPSLRDVALTAPYMHNGSLASLDDVVEFYDRGGSSLGAAPENKDPRIRPLRLTAEEKSDLVAFLLTLTGDPLEARLADPPAAIPPP